MIVLAPKTLKEFYEVRRTILELMDNPYMPEGELNSTLRDKLEYVQYQITTWVGKHFDQLVTSENAVSYNQLAAMTEIELSDLVTICWREAQYNGGFTDGNVRCYEVGVERFEYNERHNKLEWSDAAGDADVEYSNLDEKVHHLGDDKYQYGIYKIN